MTEKFKNLTAPYSFKAYYSKYPEGYSIFEALLDWLDEVNKMIDVLNLTLEEWATIKSWIQNELSNYATEVLNEMLQNGQLLIDVDYETESETLSFVFKSVTEMGE